MSSDESNPDEQKVLSKEDLQKLMDERERELEDDMLFCHNFVHPLT